MEPHQKIAIPMIRIIVGLLQKQGVDTEAFFSELGLSAEMVDETRHRIPLPVYDKVQEAAVQRLNDPALGLHMGQATTLSTFGVLGHLLMSAATIRESIELFFKYHRLISDSEPSSLSEAGGIATLTYRYPKSTALCNRIRAEFGLVQVCKLGHYLLGQSIDPQEIHFEHDEPEYSAEYHAIFNAPVLYNQPHTRIRFNAQVLEEPLLHGNTGLTDLLEEEAQRQLYQIGSSQSVADEVERHVYQLIRQERPTIAKVAQLMNMNERTLRRKLEQYQTSFSEILSHAQLKLAKKMLQDIRIQIDDIACYLQFSEPSAFYRAFKRWTGETPAEYRDRHAR